MRRASRRIAALLHYLDPWQALQCGQTPFVESTSRGLCNASTSQARCLSTGLALNSRASSVLWRSGRSRDLPALYQASSVCDVRTPTIGVRAFTSAAESKEDYDRLASSEIMQLLDAAGIDYRDCVEKSDLVERLRQSRLPAHVKARMDAVILSRSGTGAPTAAHAHAPASVQSSVPAEIVPELTAEEQTSVAVFKLCSRSAVHITTHTQVQTPFSSDVLEMPGGTGSGFVWDDAGHIVTNYHVVQRATRGGIIRATLSDGTVVPARIIGVEPEKDVAVLRALEQKGVGKAPGWVPVTLGSSSKLQVGQRVYAIGNPFGLDQTLTTGIVSGLGREVTGVAGNKIREVIQTDAAINPGNSGGPLIDSRGRLIGINTMIYSTSGMFAGVGFAIPVDTVRRVVNQIIRYGRVRKAGIGVFCLPDATARNIGKVGVVVQSVLKGSGADQAGIQGLRRDETGRVVVGDEVLAVGGEPVRTVEDLMTALEAFDAGDVCTLSVRRENGRVEEVHVRLQERMTA